MRPGALALSVTQRILAPIGAHAAALLPNALRRGATQTSAGYSHAACTTGLMQFRDRLVRRRPAISPHPLVPCPPVVCRAS